MIFLTYVAGIPCQCEVLEYQPYQPMRITGSGYGDAEPPEDEVFEFRLLDLNGYPAAWLEKKVTDVTICQLKEEYLSAQ